MCDTPMIKQYRQVKAQHQEAILFFRMGDFYEMFFEDAEQGSRLLGIALTARNKGSNAVPMAGVPVKAVDGYVRKLIDQGYKVAICDQIEDPQEAVGLVDRDVVRIITPGTITEEEVLAEKRNNYLLAIAPSKNLCGLAWIDISTGQFIVHESQRALLMDEIARIAPAECLLPEKARELMIATPDRETSLEQLIRLAEIPITYRADWFFDSKTGKHKLLEHFQVASLESYGCQDFKCGLGAAGALLHYLFETQKNNFAHIDRLERFNSGEMMFLDRATRNCLEIQLTMRHGKKQGTLLNILDHTKTPMGGRLLAAWLAAPLIVPEKIRARQQGVHNFVNSPNLLQELAVVLSQIQDLERLCSRIGYQRANARDLLGLHKSLAAIPRVKELLNDCHAQLLVDICTQLTSLDKLTELLAAALHPDPKPTLKEGNIIRDNYHQELDELRALQTSASDWIEEFASREIERTGIPSLKVNFNKVFGYYIEVTHTHSHKVPQDYIRKQTLKNAERYITNELKEYEEKILSACERIKSLEYELFMELRAQVVTYLPQIRQVARAIAYIDVLCSLAKIARERNYTCPEITSSMQIAVVEGKHPVLEVTQAAFVANDLNLGPGREVLIITGPNMAGKSTYIRQTALLVLMAQIGSFLPAKSATIGVVDRIFTRIGTADEIAQGRSTFLVEMLETANILNNAGKNSLIVLDEVGRGTSTFDGISLAWSIIEYVQKKIGSRILFATHYHEIAELAEVFPNVHNYNVSVQEWQGEITFLYRIVPGSADKSYGIHVAKLAGIPHSVLKRSREILRNLEKHITEFQTFTRHSCSGKKNNNGANLFSLVGEEIIDTLAHVDINQLTPVEAFDLLKELHYEAKKL